MPTRKRRSDRSGRASLRSPGRPPVAGRGEQHRFWVSIAAGVSSEDAAVGAGVPQAVETRWFRKAGGMPPATCRRSAKPLSGRYLSLSEREELAILHSQGLGVRQIARRIGRSASTVSRELRRNAATRSGIASVRPGGQSLRSWRSTRRCDPTCRSAWPARSLVRAGWRFLGRAYRGRDADMDLVSHGDGRRLGARSRFPAAYGSISPTMEQCGSAMKPSTRRYSCKAGARCAGS